jgi:hydrogenase/urease accessory protein HupE
MLLLAGARPALAHDPGLSTAQLHILPGHLKAELTLAQADVAVLTPLDNNADGQISPTEWVDAQTSLNHLASEAWKVDASGHVMLQSSASARHDASNNVHFIATFPVLQPGAVTCRSDLVARLPRGHRQFVTVLDATGRVVSETLLSAGKATINLEGRVTRVPDLPFGSHEKNGDSQSLSFQNRDSWSSSRQQGSAPASTFGGFLALGLEHILTGFDHLLFLFALLLMAPGFRQAAGIITSFTVAHSITLGLATLDVVHVSPRIVEPLIAASIVYVGVENLVRRDGLHGRWLLTFAFGLVHGFGFASVLREMGVTSGSTGIATPLLAFNLGVETGQLAIAAAALPILWQARQAPTFARRTMPLCSSVVVALGTWWFLSRTIL